MLGSIFTNHFTTLGRRAEESFPSETPLEDTLLPFKPAFIAAASYGAFYFFENRHMAQIGAPTSSLFETLDTGSAAPLLEKGPWRRQSRVRLSVVEVGERQLPLKASPGLTPVSGASSSGIRSIPAIAF